MFKFQISSSTANSKLKRCIFGKKEIITLLLILIVCILGSFFVYKIAVKPAMRGIYAVPMQTEIKANTRKITPTTKITQSFTYQGEIAGVQLYFTTHGITNNYGSIIAQIWDENANYKLAESEVPLVDIKDDQAVNFRIDQFVTCKSGKKYILIIKPGNTFDNNCTLALDYGNLNNNYPQNISSTFTYDGEINNGSLTLTILHSNIFIKKFFLFLSGMVTLILLLSYYFLFIKKARIQTIFLFLAFSLGILYLFILPPISSPDEDTHFATTYEYSNHFFGQFMEPKKDVIPETINATTLINGETHKHAHYRISARETDASAFQKLLKYPGIGQYRIIEEGVLQNLGNPNQFDSEIQECVLAVSPIVYAPGIMGVTLARIFGLSGVQLILLGRFFNMGFYILLVYLAVKKIPFGKVTLSVIALLPITLHLAASFSYDAMLNGCAFLFIALVFSLAYEKRKMRWYDVAIFIYCASVFGSNKAIYMALLFFALIIPCENKNFRKQGIIVFAVLIVIAVTTFAISTLGNIFAKNFILVANGDNYTYSYIVQHPISFIGISLNSFISSLSFYLYSMIGGSLGWLDINIQWIIIIGFISIIFLSMLKYESEYEISQKASFIGIFIFLSILLGTYAAALTWNPIGSKIINGVQGRYFLPVLPVLLYGLKRNLNFVNLRKNINRILLYLFTILHVLTLSTVFQTIISR